jgi:hypothetical protein
MYENVTQFQQQATNDQQAKNTARRLKFQNNQQQGQYPFAAEGSAIAKESGLAAMGGQQAQQGTATQRAAAQVPQQTFAQLQASGQARPAPPPPAPAPAPQQMQAAPQQMAQALFGSPQQQMQPTGNSVSMQGFAQPGMMSQPFQAAQGQTGQPSNVTQALQQLLANPSSYNTDAVMGTYGRLAGQIDDEFNQRNVGINEEMARRGIFDSSIAGGRLGDSNVARRSAQVELADRLAQQQAEKMDEARRGAIGLGLTDQGQRFDQSSRDADISLRSQLGLGDLGLRRDQFGENVRQFGMEFGENQRQFNDGLDFKYEDMGQSGMLDFLKMMGVDVADYATGAGAEPGLANYRES